MRDCSTFYECVAVHVDNLLIASKDLESIIKCLLDNHKFKFKGSSPIKYHLDCNFFRDSNNTLCFAPKKYAAKIISIF